jgi:hypothetical protein
MHRLAKIFFILSLFLTLNTTNKVISQTTDPYNDNTTPAQDRLVVFETVMCHYNKTAGIEVDRIAIHNANKPVVFIEYPVNAPQSRDMRFWTACGCTSADTPLTWVDSGYKFISGLVEFRPVYQAMVDAALLRPPKAEIQAVWWRETDIGGSYVMFYIQVKNLTSDTLSYSANGATVHAIAYEDAHVQHTDHFGRDAAETGIWSGDLAPNATGVYRVRMNDFNLIANPYDNFIDANWDKLHFIALVDYRPGGSIGRYDMLQATYATPVDSPFKVKPDSITFLVDPADSSIPSKLVHFIGPSFINWTSTSDNAWWTILPFNGSGSTQPAISVAKNDLVPGWQQGNITFTTTDGYYSDQVPISAYLGPVIRYYMPMIAR